MIVRRLSCILFLLFLSLIHSCTAHSGSEASLEFFTVTKVVDGDTFWIDDGSEKGLKIRLIGVDAPESRNVFKKVAG
jgi:micrococcal nuclease